MSHCDEDVLELPIVVVDSDVPLYDCAVRDQLVNDVVFDVLKPNPVIPGALRPVPLSSVVGEVLLSVSVNWVPTISIVIVAEPTPLASMP
jgi:hypothetical protein